MSHSASSPASAGRGGALDALRFVASLLIVLYHFGGDAPVALETLHPVFERGYLATDFFLILSGFVLGRAYGAQVMSGRIGLLAFVRKRIARIWPGQLVVLATLAGIVAVAGLAGVAPNNPEHFTAMGLAMQALLVQAWGVPGGEGWNHQSWSLSALIVCYAAFPLAWRWISRLNSPAALLSLGLTAVMLGDLICAIVLGRHIYDLDFHFGVIRAAPLFLLGICIARLVETGRPSVGAAKIMAGLSLAAVVLLQIAGRFDLPSIAAIAAIVLSFGRLPVARPSALIEQGAKLSFALFITHAVTGLLWFGALQALRGRVALPAWIDWSLWAMSLPAAFVAAALFHRFVDEPIQKWLAPRLKRPAPAAAPVEPTPASV
ncbi:acyltransferase [Caulobacter mirabilis]|uniref:Acyltransferase n=1 Tax=Caulobacter mirabilis TaxID=69666 RepID=A0A2D2B3L4_9CAUL|nr:acyltransferase [Caulobacter mirabilis]